MQFLPGNRAGRYQAFSVSHGILLGDLNNNKTGKMSSNPQMCKMGLLAEVIMVVLEKLTSSHVKICQEHSHKTWKTSQI